MTRKMVALVLAAGLSTRFAGDKLVHPYRGKPLAAHIADVLAGLPFDTRLAVCPTTNAARREIFEERGFEIIANDDPAIGLSSSLALGARRAIELDAEMLLVCLADMPHISPAYIMSLVGELDRDVAIVASQTGAARSPPVVFARRALSSLLTLNGDAGARPLLASAKAMTLPSELAADFDTRADFDRPNGGS